MRLPEDFKIGLTLSGGASYGIAHIGVIKALREYGIEPQYLYGTSAGAIAAVLYSGGASIRDMRQFSKTNQLKKLIRLTYPRLGFSSMDPLEKRLEEYTPFDNLEELPRKTFVGVTNLETGKHETFSEGPIGRIVAASCAVPVFFQPIEINDQLYLDGGVSNNMPAKLLRKHCDLIIGSDVVKTGRLNRKRIKSVGKLLERTLTISLAHRTVSNYPDCDFVFQLSGLGRYGKFDFSKVDQFVEIGYRQALKTLPDFLDVVREKLLQKEGK